MLYTVCIMVTKTDMVPDPMDPKSSGRDEHMTRHLYGGEWAMIREVLATLRRVSKSVLEDKGRHTGKGYI